MTIVVAGATGFLGRAAVRVLGDVVPIGRGETADGDVLVWAAGRRDSPREVHVDAAVAAARRVSRVVYLSTGEVYGDAPVPWREDAAPMPNSDYARAKLAGEAALAVIVPTVALRIGVAYGREQRPPMVLPSIVEAVRAGRPIALTEGRQTRDFVFVEDVALAIVRAVAAPAGVYNIGSGIETPVRDACELLGRLLGAPELLRFGARPMRDDDLARYVLDPSRARDVLGWRATTPLAVGLATLAE
jgi:nucleoside-diphosphate-sugar epimerase